MLDNFYVIQAIGFIGTILSFASFQCKSVKNLFRVQFGSYFCYTVHLMLLGAAAGGLSYILNTVRSFCLGSKYDFLKSKTMCAIICVLQLAALYFTWDGWWAVLPIAANIASTIGGYTNNAKTVRLVAMLINSPLWIVYCVIVGSWAGIMDEVVTELSVILSIWRYGWNNLDDKKE